MKETHRICDKCRQHLHTLTVHVDEREFCNRSCAEQFYQHRIADAAALIESYPRRLGQQTAAESGDVSEHFGAKR